LPFLEQRAKTDRVKRIERSMSRSTKIFFTAKIAKTAKRRSIRSELEVRRNQSHKFLSKTDYEDSTAVAPKPWRSWHLGGEFPSCRIASADTRRLDTPGARHFSQ
jgi:hypothetical protein